MAGIVWNYRKYLNNLFAIKKYIINFIVCILTQKFTPMKNFILLLFTGLLLLLSVDTFAEKYETFPLPDFELCEHDQSFAPDALPYIPINSGANFINNITTVKPFTLAISLLIKRPGWQNEHEMEVYNDNKKTLLSQKI